MTTVGLTWGENHRVQLHKDIIYVYWQVNKIIRADNFQTIFTWLFSDHWKVFLWCQVCHLHILDPFEVIFLMIIQMMIIPLDRQKNLINGNVGHPEANCSTPILRTLMKIQVIMTSFRARFVFYVDTWVIIRGLDLRDEVCRRLRGFDFREEDDSSGSSSSFIDAFIAFSMSLSVPAPKPNTSEIRLLFLRVPKVCSMVKMLSGWTGCKRLAMLFWTLRCFFSSFSSSIIALIVLNNFKSSVISMGSGVGRRLSTIGFEQITDSRGGSTSRGGDTGGGTIDSG